LTHDRLCVTVSRIIKEINHEQSQHISDEAVIEQWMKLFNGNVLIQRYLNGECKSEGELDKVQETIELWRSRLLDTSE